MQSNTGNDRYSGHGYSGIDRYSGTKTSDDAILFTVSGIDRYSGTKNPDDAILFTVSGITTIMGLYFLEKFQTLFQK